MTMNSYCPGCLLRFHRADGSTGGYIDIVRCDPCETKKYEQLKRRCGGSQGVSEWSKKRVSKKVLDNKI